MTVSYTARVATAQFGSFGRLLLRWKGSVYKLVWKEMFVFVIIYVTIACVYHYALDCEKRKMFSAFAKYCNDNNKVIPLTFVMGFFVNLIVDRWWSILMTIGWPDRACMYISMCLSSDEPAMVQTRRAIARYLNLAQLLILCDVSTSVKTRFPSLDKIVSDGFMTEEEKTIFVNVKSENKLQKHNKYWLALQWASNLLCRAYDQKKVRDAYSFSRAFAEIVDFRDRLGKLLAYDWVSIPLSYTQVVTLVVYFYFGTALIGRQYYDLDEQCPADRENFETFERTNRTNVVCCQQSDGVHPAYRFMEKYAPIFPILEFLFYMGWLKVAESIMNPMGQDDDDFEINYIIDRNLAISYGIVDSYRDTCPQLKMESLPQPASSKVKAKSYRGSTAEYDPTVNPDGTAMTRKRRRLRRGSEGGDVSLTGPPMSPIDQLSASVSKLFSPRPNSKSTTKSPAGKGPGSKTGPPKSK